MYKLFMSNNMNDPYDCYKKVTIYFSTVYNETSFLNFIFCSSTLFKHNCLCVDVKLRLENTYKNIADNKF